MRVQCVFRPGDPIPDELIPLGYTPVTRFDVLQGRVYTIFSMSLWGSVIHYLLLNDQTGRPDWFPSFLFKIVDDHLPTGWRFVLCDRSVFAVDAIWGYPEMAQEDARHYVDLIEREPAALQTFQRRRVEIEVEADDR